MEFKGTKGKWHYEIRKSNFFVYTLNKDKIDTIAQIYYVINESNSFDKQNEYNAKLMSKAPEMLQILKDTYLHIDALSRKMKDPTYSQGMKSRAEQIKELIKEATEL